MFNHGARIPKGDKRATLRKDVSLSSTESSGQISRFRPTPDHGLGLGVGSSPAETGVYAAVTTAEPASRIPIITRKTIRITSSIVMRACTVWDGSEVQSAN